MQLVPLEINLGSACMNDALWSQRTHIWAISPILPEPQAAERSSLGPHLPCVWCGRGMYLQSLDPKPHPPNHEDRSVVPAPCLTHITMSPSVNTSYIASS